MRVHACRLMHSNPTVERSAAPGNVESVPTPSMPEAEEPVLEEPVPEQPVEPTSFTFVYDVEEEENVSTENDECNLIDFSSDCEVASPTIDLPMSPEVAVATDQIEGESEQQTSIVETKEPVTTNGTQQSKENQEKLRKNDIIEVFWADETTSAVKLVSRSGKVGRTAKNKYQECWNVVNPEGVSMSLDLMRDIVSWNFLCEDQPSSEVEFGSNEIFQAEMKDEIESAKQVEIDKWKDQSVFCEVEDEGQTCVSTRWVVESKVKESGESFLRARLVARGFEEDQNFRKDAPTCARESVRFTLSVIASNQWTLKSIDIKSAFLQGRQMERTVFLRPPPESGCSNKLWKLNKCVYGLADAPREFYIRLTTVLKDLGMTPSRLDKSLFTFVKNGSLLGIMIIHVDDLLYAGTSCFEKDVIEPLHSIFSRGSKQIGCFTYIGIHLKQLDDKSIVVDQARYTESLKKVEIDPHRSPADPVSEKQRTSLRSAIGQLNWLAGVTRPDLAFDVCQLSTRVVNATGRELILVNKVIKRAKNECVRIRFPVLNLSQLRIVAFADASFNNLPNGGS